MFADLRVLIKIFPEINVWLATSLRQESTSQELLTTSIALWMTEGVSAH